MASRGHPVIVLFAAPWNQPSKPLGDLIERLVSEAEKPVQLLRIDASQAPSLVSRFSIRVLPAVMAFRDGDVAARIAGHRSEREVRAELEPVLPSRAGEHARLALAHFAEGRSDSAEAHYRAALSFDPRHAASLLGLGRVLAMRGAFNDADTAFRQVPKASSQAGAATAGRAAIGLAVELARLVERDTAPTATGSESNPDQARYRWALAQAILGRRELSLAVLSELAASGAPTLAAGARSAIGRITDAFGASREH